MKLEYTCPEKSGGKSVYTVMRRELSFSASLVRRLKQAGQIFVNGKSVYSNYEMAAGDRLTVDIGSVEPPCDIVPEDGEISVIYENDWFIAVNKPSGMIVHPSHAKYTGTLANYVAGYLQRTSGCGVCHAVNRLDRDTSGIVLFAKNSHAKALGSEALAAADAKKEYVALVLGEFSPERGTIDLPIRRKTESEMLRIVVPDGQSAVTHYDTVSSCRILGKTVSAVHIILETGRTHQIRVHFSHLGHPILGDILYYTDESKRLSEELDIHAQLLHASRLSFTDPLTKQAVTLSAVPERKIFSKMLNEDEFFS